MLKKKSAIERHRREADVNLAARVDALKAKGMTEAQIQRDAVVRHCRGKIRQARFQLARIEQVEAMNARQADTKAARQAARKLDSPRKRRPADPAKQQVRQARKMAAIQEAEA